MIRGLSPPSDEVAYIFTIHYSLKSEGEAWVYTFIENRIKYIWRVRNEQIRGQRQKDLIKRLVKFKGLSKKIRVNYNFTERWKHSNSKKKDKTFSQRILITESIICYMKLKQFKKTNENQENRKVQANKSIRWMPWHQEPKKDVTSCEKLRGAANEHWSVDIRMGKPS